MRILITPSILSANFGHLQAEVDSVTPYADWLQLDVMDGHFVPNISFGVPVAVAIKTTLPLDVHLMVTNPADRIAEFAAMGVKNITFHAEAVTATADRKALIAAIRSTKVSAGIALNPETPLSAINDILPDIDLVLIMTVHPGFGGQKFLEENLEKVKTLRSKFPDLMIQVDGGIDVKTAALARAAGADNLVAGSSVFRADDRVSILRALRG